MASRLDSWRAASWWPWRSSSRPGGWSLRLPTTWPWPGSLRARLLAAFAAVILITLIAAGSGVVWLVQESRRQAAVGHLQDLAIAASGVAGQLERQGAQPEEIALLLAKQIRVPSARVLVLDSQGQVLAEQAMVTSGGSDASRRPTAAEPDPAFVGQRLRAPAPSRTAPPASRLGLQQPDVTVWTDTVAGGRYVLVYGDTGTGAGGPGDSSAARPRPGDRFLSRQPLYRVVLAVPDQDLGAAWREMALRLAPAASIAAVVAAGAAWSLAQSITRPLRRITRAAERIAAGDLRQSIVVQGSDEVVQLGRAFNRMSQEVDRSNRSLRDFVANASHELRTPLTSIEGYSQAFLDGVLETPEETSAAATVIHGEAQRMRHLVDDLLHLSQAEAATTVPGKQPVDVGAVIREATQRLARAAAKRGIAVGVKLPDGVMVRGDEAQLTHLFGNLLENAGKYAATGGRISVTGRHESGQLTVAIHNTGSHIPPEEIPRIFERFYRVDRSRVRGAGEVEGNGLGLAIAWEVVQRHGGSLRAESDPASGTTFVVTLPALTRVGESARGGFLPGVNAAQGQA